MHKVFLPEDLHNRELVCTHCSWKGKDGETKKEELFLTDAIELYCPRCETYLGFISKEGKDLN